MPKNSHLFLLLLVAGFATSHGREQVYQENIDLPSAWNREIESEQEIDPDCFRWWESFNDPVLTELVETSGDNLDVRLAACVSHEQLLQAVNKVAAAVARNYITLRSAQARLKIVEETIHLQDRILALEAGIAKKLLSEIEVNESKINRHLFVEQKSSFELAIEKAINDLNMLLSRQPGDGCDELLMTAQELPQLPLDFPLESPCELIARHPAVQEAKKIYQLAQNKQTFLNYKKAILTVLNGVENSLAAIDYAVENYNAAFAIKELRYHSYQLKKDLFEKGLKDERESLAAYQQYLQSEDKFVESNVELLMSYVNFYESLSLGWEINCN